MACGDCIQHQVGSSEFLEQLALRDAGDDSFPLAGSLELTLRCNVRCKHCYILYPGATDGEMSTSQVFEILDKLAAKGVLFLLLTGGEVLARCDFREIYLHAKQLGFLVTLFTNGTLIDEDTADFLAKWPPRRIEITIYGHTEATYEAVTGVRGSFQRFRRGIDLLIARRLNLRLKTIVLKTNEHEFEDIRDWVTGLGVSFRFDAMVNPKLDGDRTPTSERIDPENYVRLEGTAPQDEARFRRLREMAAGSKPDGRLFKCGAGIRTFHVDPRGQLHPCMMWRSTPYDLLRKPLDDGWREHIAGLRSTPAPSDTSCGGCGNRLACGNCAATSLLETGVAGKNVGYYCRIGKAREMQFGEAKPRKLIEEMAAHG